VFRDFSSASHGSESLQKKKFPGCGALKNGASQSFFCLDRFKFTKSALYRRNYKIIMGFGSFFDLLL